jgi:NAD(P)H-dependent flavin oxidoreductase YrpB (nitropropane dioxygenase family)
MVRYRRRCQGPSADPIGTREQTPEPGLNPAVMVSSGEPRRDLVDAGHSAYPLVSWQVGSSEEARAAEAPGCDIVAAEDTEACGHVCCARSLDDLLAEVLLAVWVP